MKWRLRKHELKRACTPAFYRALLAAGTTMHAGCTIIVPRTGPTCTVLCTPEELEGLLGEATAQQIFSESSLDNCEHTTDTADQERREIEACRRQLLAL